MIWTMRWVMSLEVLKRQSSTFMAASILINKIKNYLRERRKRKVLKRKTYSKTMILYDLAISILILSSYNFYKKNMGN